MRPAVRLTEARSDVLKPRKRRTHWRKCASQKSSQEAYTLYVVIRRVKVGAMNLQIWETRKKQPKTRPIQRLLILVLPTSLSIFAAVFRNNWASVALNHLPKIIRKLAFSAVFLQSVAFRKIF